MSQHTSITVRLALHDLQFLPPDGYSEHWKLLVYRCVARQAVPDPDTFVPVERSTAAKKLTISVSAYLLDMIDRLRGPLSRAEFCVFALRREGKPLYRAVRKVPLDGVATPAGRLPSPPPGQQAPIQPATTSSGKATAGGPVAGQTVTDLDCAASRLPSTLPQHRAPMLPASSWNGSAAAGAALARSTPAAPVPAASRLPSTLPQHGAPGPAPLPPTPTYLPPAPGSRPPVRPEPGARLGAASVPALVERERLRKAAQRQREQDAADEAEVDRLCARQDAITAARMFAALDAAPPPSPARHPTRADPLRSAVTPAPPPPPPMRPAPSHAPAPALVEPVQVVQRVAQLDPHQRASTTTPEKKPMSHEENSSENKYVSVTIKVGDIITLEHLRRHLDEKGVENVKPNTFVHVTLEDEIEIDITDPVHAAKRGGTVRHLFGLRSTAGIPYALMREAEGNAVNERVQELLKETGLHLNVTITMYVVPMAKDDTRVAGYDEPPVSDNAADHDQEDSGDDDVIDDAIDDEELEDTVTPDDEENEEKGIVLVVSVVRVA